MKQAAPQHALIAGCGHVGKELAHRLAGKGLAVTAARRNSAPLSPGIDTLSLDITRPDSYPAFPETIDSLCFCAAANTSHERVEMYRALFIDGLAALVDRLKKETSLRRIILLSSSGLYGDHEGAVVDETSACLSQDPAHRVLLEAEQQLESMPFCTSSLRLSGIYGPGRIRLIRRVDRPEPCRLAPAPYYLNQVHRDDAAASAAHVLHLDDPASLYLVSDRMPATRLEVYSWLSEQLGRPAPVLDSDAEDGMHRGQKRCSSDRLAASGYPFIYPTYKEGYAALLPQAGT